MVYRKAMTNIVLLGDQRVGKTSWLYKIQGKNQINIDSYIATMGRTNTSMRYKNRYITFHDVGGYERFHTILTCNFSIADGFLIFYDVKNNASKRRVEYWKNKIPKDQPCVVVGNKIDLIKKPTIDAHEISCYKNKNLEQPLDDLLQKIPVHKRSITILEQLLEYLFYFLPLY